MVHIIKIALGGVPGTRTPFLDRPIYYSGPMGETTMEPRTETMKQQDRVSKCGWNGDTTNNIDVSSGW